MSFLFKPKKVSPSELVRLTRELLLKAEAGDKKKVADDISKNLACIKATLYGDGENEPSKDTVAQLANEIYAADLLGLLVQELNKLDFEAKKDASQVFSNLLRYQVINRFPTVEYLMQHQQILFYLLSGYANHDIALHSGIIFRECIRHEALAQICLMDQRVWQFFDYVQVSTFDVSSDAFASFKDLLTRHKPLVAKFLESNYDMFFEQYTILLNSTNYVTKRQSLKLLGELLLDRTNFNIMTKYISSVENLKLMMNLLRDESRSIQFEAFHVFKVFVANPNKAKGIIEILLKNQEKLIGFLSKFHTDRADDEQFNEEKAFLIKQVQGLQLT